MVKRNKYKNKNYELGLFRTVKLHNDHQISNKIIFEIKKNSSISNETELFKEAENVKDVFIWSVINSKIDISLSKVNVTKLKKIFIVAPISILRIIILNNEKQKIVNILVKDLFVIKKENNIIYIRFSSDFKIITKKSMLKKFEETIGKKDATFFEKQNHETKNIIFNEQKRKINEKHKIIKKYYQMSKNKNYNVNIFNKIDYYASKISILEEFLYGEMIKTMLFKEEIPSINKKEGMHENNI